jgi:hypothetical protein
MKFRALFFARALILGIGVLLLGGGLFAPWSFGQPLEFVDDATSEPPLPDYVDPGEIRRGVPMGGVPGKSRARLYYERIIQRIEPGSQG